MNYSKSLTLFLLCLFFNLFTVQVNAQSPKKRQINRQLTQRASISKLRDFYLKYDFANGLKFGKSLVRKSPADLELQAWYLMNMARLPDENEESIKRAKHIIAEAGDNYWILLALTTAQTYKVSIQNDVYIFPFESLETAQKLIKLYPDDEEGIFAYNYALIYNSKFADSIKWLNENFAKIKDKSRFYSNRAVGKYMLMLGQKNLDLRQKEREATFDDFAQAIKINANSIESNYLYGKYLKRDERFNDAVIYLRKAAELSPSSLKFREDFWNALHNQENKTDDEKNAEILRDLKNYLLVQKSSPESLLVAVSKLDELKLESERDFYENLTLRQYPNSKYEEKVIYERGFRTPHNARIPVFLDYISRPIHYDENKLSQVYDYLSQFAGSSKNITDEQLLKMFEGILTYLSDDSININSRIAKILMAGENARPKSLLNKDAEKYARAAIIEAEEKSRRVNAGSAKILQSQAYNTLAEILTKKQNFDEAESLLMKSENITAGNHSKNLELRLLSELTNFNLAKLYEARKDYDKAEEYYLKDTDNPDQVLPVFKRIYSEKNGNLNDFNNYFARIKEKVFRERRKKILATKLANPSDFIPFNLKSLDKKVVSFEELKGKIIVINAWGTWCAPCVAELPQLQKLYEKYQTDKNVVILTLDVDDELKTVEKFMTDKKYTFPVIIDDGYSSKNSEKNGSGGSLPVTFFINEKGKVVFVAQGSSDYLFEEFGWRIDAMKGN